MEFDYQVATWWTLNSLRCGKLWTEAGLVCPGTSKATHINHGYWYSKRRESKNHRYIIAIQSRNKDILLSFTFDHLRLSGYMALHIVCSLISEKILIYPASTKMSFDGRHNSGFYTYLYFPQDSGGRKERRGRNTEGKRVMSRRVNWNAAKINCQDLSALNRGESRHPWARGWAPFRSNAKFDTLRVAGRCIKRCNNRMSQSA